MLKSREVNVFYEIDEDKSVYDAVSRMVEKDVGSLIVVRSGRLCGIITERDYLRKVVVKGRNSRELLIREIMTPASTLVVVTPESTVRQCTDIMRQCKFRHLPIVGDKGEVLGMISIRDLVDQMVSFHEAQVKQLQEYITFPIW